MGLPKATILSHMGRICLLGEKKQRQVERTDIGHIGGRVDGSPIFSLLLKETGVSIAVSQDTEL